ncbi:UDP-N-acetylglucosamine 2-epimerase [Pedobacter helvus]|uniref:UDP-N-acetylglucosamine 2-epimerase n=1 Tax=Pedobacter helvus TaxID=2563444 RepID=A0ABW9JFJ8_9SPHI|nr:UDP-N-acetylglucosamine 2-epimerase [Pedobacter ureilyticus]
MENKRKVCIVTGTRAEYGLLYWVIKGVNEDLELDLQLIVTGMHLSPEFGLTYKQIENDGFHVNKKIEVLLSSDTPVGIAKSMGLGSISFAEAYAELEPDIILVLGDRFEIFSAVSAAMVSRIPVAHCHGGEATEGLIDEPIRHSITKMSHLHFTSTEEYKNRVIQLGEQPKSVYNTGALGIENVNRLSLLDLDDFEKSINFQIKDKFTFLVTFHPVTLETSSAKRQIEELLDALSTYPEAKIIFTKANADTDGRIINQLIDEYVSENSSQSIAFTSLGQLRYLSALTHVDLVIGNSSSGLLEVPSFKKPTINIGDRQLGRVKAKSVIDCEATKESICNAINKANSKEFKEQLQKIVNPYGKENASEKIIEVLKSTDLTKILKKKFYNII